MQEAKSEILEVRGAGRNKGMQEEMAL